MKDEQLMTSQDKVRALLVSAAMQDKHSTACGAALKRSTLLRKMKPKSLRSTGSKRFTGPLQSDADYPYAQSIRLRLCGSDDRSGSMHEQTAQISVAALANAEQSPFSSRAVLFGREPK